MFPLSLWNSTILTLQSSQKDFDLKESNHTTKGYLWTSLFLCTHKNLFYECSFFFSFTFYLSLSESYTFRHLTWGIHMQSFHFMSESLLWAPFFFFFLISKFFEGVLFAPCSVELRSFAFRNPSVMHGGAYVEIKLDWTHVSHHVNSYNYLYQALTLL